VRFVVSLELLEDGRSDIRQGRGGGVDPVDGDSYSRNNTTQYRFSLYLFILFTKTSLFHVFLFFGGGGGDGTGAVSKVRGTVLIISLNVALKKNQKRYLPASAHPPERPEIKREAAQCYFGYTYRRRRNWRIWCSVQGAPRAPPPHRPLSFLAFFPRELREFFTARPRPFS
jgi:hypothetical protein